MSDEVMMFGQVMFIIVASIGALSGIGLVTRAMWRVGSRKPAAAALPAEDTARLQRLEHAVESIAIEVERISEGQRFTVALLSDRLPAHERTEALGAPKRVNTPH